MPLTLPNVASVADNLPPANGPLPTSIQSPAATTAQKANYRPLPTKVKSVGGTKKRGRDSNRSRPKRYFEDSETGNETENHSDELSDSSVPSDAPALTKRQRTSTIVTRSSTWLPAPGTSADGVPYSVSPVPVVTAHLSPTTPDADTGASNPIMSIGSPGPQSTDPSADGMDVDGSGEDAHSASYYISPTESKVPYGADSEGPVTTDTENPSTTDTEDPTFTDAENTTATDADVPGEVPCITNPEVTPVTETGDPSVTINTVIRAASAGPALHPPSPALLDDIDEASVPAFLLLHGTGKRQVNIFAYLNEVTDPRFRRVLSHYLRFETDDRSEKARSLPTEERPAEVGRWTTKARPAGIPDYTKGKRSFADFVDSIFKWWGLIQPSWRTFERGEVSREVQGGWTVLCSPCINGLLNVVILVYWWVKILEEHEPEDGARADYEFFADDVAWVLSNLYT